LGYVGWDIMRLMGNEIEEYREEVRLRRALAVMEHQVEHGSSLREACAANNVPVTTFYRWLADGLLTDRLSEDGEGLAAAVQMQAASALTDVVDYMIQIATGKVQVRGANPVAAARWLAELANIRTPATRISAAEPSASQHQFAPPLVQFNLVNYTPAVDDQGRIEVIEGQGEYIENPDDGGNSSVKDSRQDGEQNPAHHPVSETD